MPLGALKGREVDPFPISVSKGKNYVLVIFISLGLMMALFPKVAINLFRTYEKLHCKEEPYRFYISRFFGTDTISAMTIFINYHKIALNF